MTDKNEKPVHIKKFAGGQMTPDEMWRLYGVRDKCQCGQMGAIRIRTFMRPADLIKHSDPVTLAAIMQKYPDGMLPTQETKDGPMVLVGNTAVCPSCKVTAERVAARLPSYVYVDISRGPDPTNKVTVGAHS
jgi:hypothetical protein